ncbi:MAG: aminotransferase class III-fold pyridoxal phosphate-dependent enzyme, partial [Paracoccaceae bacterium]|nr:aminotransferase class III-fold pyridoxal phosphate-dependent enzyme [Paracoccaceae bacterium]
RALISHGYTYSAHPVGAAAAIACLAETKRLKVWENATPRGTQLYDGLVKLKEEFSIVGDVRGGHGLMAGIEFVKDRATKEPVSPDLVVKIQKTAYENGAMVRPLGNALVMSPPLIITADQIDTILNALRAGLKAHG